MEKILPYSRNQVRQDTYYNCGPASSQNVILAATGKTIPESTLAAGLGTTVNGTDYIGLFPRVLNAHIPGAAYKHRDVGNYPDAALKDVMWREMTGSINAGHGVIINIVAPPSNYPRAVAPSTESPRYGGGVVYHYIAALGYSDKGGRKLWIADSGFAPYGYWISFDQICTLIVPKGYAYSTAAAKHPPAPVENKPQAAGHILGIDISSWQNGMPLSRAKREGMEFVIVRTTDGTYRDTCYRSHILDAEQHGLLTMAYHYLRNPNEGSSIAQQVNTALDVMGDLKRPIWLDCETPAGLHVNHIREAKRLFEAAGVRVIGCYSYVPYWEGSIAPGEPDSHEFGAFWVAAYGSNPDGSPSQVYAARGGNNASQWNYPLGNQKPVLWQYGSKAEVAGFADVDVNAFRGTREELHTLITGKPTLKKEELELSNIDQKRIKLTLDQLAGPGTNKQGEPTFNGWSFDSVLAAAKKKQAANSGLTMVEMLVLNIDAQGKRADATDEALRALNESFTELIKAVGILNQTVEALADNKDTINPEVQ